MYSLKNLKPNLAPSPSRASGLVGSAYLPPELLNQIALAETPIGHRSRAALYPTISPENPVFSRPSLEGVSEK